MVKSGDSEGAPPVGQHFHMVEPHGRYVQNLAFNQLAHEGLTLLQQRELQKISCSRVSHHRLVAIAVELKTVTGGEHRDPLAAGDLKPKG